MPYIKRQRLIVLDDPLQPERAAYIICQCNKFAFQIRHYYSARCQDCHRIFPRPMLRRRNFLNKMKALG